MPRRRSRSRPRRDGPAERFRFAGSPWRTTMVAVGLDASRCRWAEIWRKSTESSLADWYRFAGSFSRHLRITAVSSGPARFPSVLHGRGATMNNVAQNLRLGLAGERLISGWRCDTTRSPGRTGPSGRLFRGPAPAPGSCNLTVPTTVRAFVSDKVCSLARLLPGSGLWQGRNPESWRDRGASP